MGEVFGLVTLVVATVTLVAAVKRLFNHNDKEGESLPGVEFGLRILPSFMLAQSVFKDPSDFHLDWGTLTLVGYTLIAIQIVWFAFEQRQAKR